MTNIGNVHIDTAKLDKITAEMKPRARAIVKKYGNMVAGEAIMRAPVDTGNLIGSISANSKMIGDMTFRVQDGTEYGVFLELGHITRLFEGSFNVRRFVAARPFMLPAVEKYRQKFLDAFEALFK